MGIKVADEINFQINLVVGYLLLYQNGKIIRKSRKTSSLIHEPKRISPT